MSIEVFNRYEKKYFIKADIFDEFRTNIQEYMDADKFNKDGKTYSICNIYYDTVDDDIITRSIQKPIYKEKLRLRGYGVPALDDMVFLEIKKKFDGIVNKRRSKLTLLQAKQMLETKKMPELQAYMNEQILREIEYELSRIEYIPALYLAYDRYAYFEKGNGDFRLTFDTNVRTRRQDLSLELGDYGDKLFPEDVYIMEMKATNAVPLWFARLLSKYKLYPTSISKYGTEFLNKLKSLETNEKTGGICDV